MVRTDVYTILAVHWLLFLLFLSVFKEWKIYLFDRSCQRARALKPLDGQHYLVLLVLIIVRIQAVGVILMAALLIIPAVSAFYWTYCSRYAIVICGFRRCRRYYWHW